MEEGRIDTRLVYGFLESGKTSYIQDCILHDYFHKYGSTLILSFEQGEEEYDLAALAQKRTQVAFYEGEGSVTAFCEDKIKEKKPDRIYVEMNAMIQGLREAFPWVMQVTFVTMRMDFKTLKLTFANFLPMITLMVKESHQVTFWDCPSKEVLAPYAQAFQLMNQRATYLRQDPMGYHERAFDLFVPFSLEQESIEITRREYLPLWLDAAEHPEHYEGKELFFSEPLEIRKREEKGPWMAGRVVMTCCMADLQFMGFELTGEKAESLEGGWALLRARAQVGTVEYGRKVLKFSLLSLERTNPLPELILSAVEISQEKSI